MNPQLYNDVIARLSEFGFKEQQGWLRQGKCPECGKKELFTHAESPWVIKCGRLNKCGFESSIKELYPDLFERWSDKYFPTPENKQNRNAAADAYLSQARGFDLDLIRGYYSQESYFDHKRQIGSATVRFPACGSWWERLIDEPGRFGSGKARFSAGSSYKGKWWVPDRLNFKIIDELWIVEGIFNAIALAHHGIAAASIMSCTNYPSEGLGYLKSLNKQKITLVWALDNDPAGNQFTRKHVERARADGWLCTASIIPHKGKYQRDWNDLHLLTRQENKNDEGVFGEKAMDEYRHYGKLLLAKSAGEKANLIYWKSQSTSFDFDFNNRWYWCEMDLEKYNKALERISGEITADVISDEIRERAMIESKSLKPIANCLPEPLYYQANDMTDESWYYYRVKFPHEAAEIKNTFTAAQLSTATEFKKRLLSIAPGGVYSGNSQMLERAIEKKLFNIKRVETIDFIGYSAKHKTYVFPNVAVKGGKIVELNKEDYFDLNKLSIKSLLRMDQLHINNNASDYTRTWSDLLWRAYGVKGYVALVYFFASLFAEQVRATQDSFPFLEITGEAATGKTTMIEFLWKLLGRVGHEGIDPEKATAAARARSFAQVSNLPVVLIESDRVSVDSKTPHAKKFEWDELKTAYNGRSIRSRGVATSGNETYDPPFRGSIVISQNEMVRASEPIMQRICYLNFDGVGYNESTRKAALALARIDAEEVSGFLLAAVSREEQILELVKANKDLYTDKLMANPKIRTGRIAHNHAQLLCFAEAVRLIVKMGDEQYAELTQYIEQMAVARQEIINNDHPMVQEFWDLFEYLNGDDEWEPRLNHSTDPAVIAINLNEYIELAVMSKQQVPTLRDLKSMIKTSRKYRYEGQRCVHSAIKARLNQPGKSTSTRCWIFRK